MKIPDIVLWLVIITYAVIFSYLMILIPWMREPNDVLSKCSFIWPEYRGIPCCNRHLCCCYCHSTDAYSRVKERRDKASLSEHLQLATF